MSWTPVGVILSRRQYRASIRKVFADHGGQGQHGANFVHQIGKIAQTLPTKNPGANARVML